MFSDLREFVDKAKQNGEVKEIEGADCESDIGALTELISTTNENPPLLLFDRIKGYEAGYRVISNVFSTHRRIALAYGLPEEARGIELVKALRDKINTGMKYQPPVQVDTGPVKENVITGADIDLFKFPSPKWHELDGGRYIGTGTMTIMRDPDTGWINVAPYRVQVHDRSTATIHIAPGHHGDIIRKRYWKKGLACPAVVTCGQEPGVCVSSAFALPWGVSEFDLAGGLRGAPVEVTRGVATDLPIPATAEIALEGEVMPPDVEQRVEGPFGEWCGYYARGAKPEAAFRIKSILHRNNPIIQGHPPSRLPAVWSFGVHIRKAALLWSDLDRQIPGVKGVWSVEQASSAGMVVISLKQEYAGHAKQAGMIAAGSTAVVRYFPFIVIVDDDIDPSNISEVLWAMGTRVDPETAIDIARGCVSSLLQPSLPPDKRSRGDTSGSKAIILACRPYHWMNQYPPAIKLSPEMEERTRKKWAHILE